MAVPAPNYPETSAVSVRIDARRITDHVMHVLFAVCGSLSILTTLGLVGVLVYESAGFFAEVSIFDFLTDTQWTPLFSDKHFGILPLACGTILISAISVGIALPCGLLIAIYLSEFCSESKRRWIKPALEILAGIPTVIYGYFALFVVTPFMQLFIPELGGFNALSPGIVMAFMILPLVASLSEDAIYSVPRSMREGAYALGASKLQMVFGVLIPSAMGGICASFILAVSRAIGETMIVAIAAGQQANLTLNPLQAVETMTAYIVQISLGDTPHGTLEYKTIFAVAAALFAMTFVLNCCSIWLRDYFKRHAN